LTRSLGPAPGEFRPEIGKPFVLFPAGKLPLPEAQLAELVAGTVQQPDSILPVEAAALWLSTCRAALWRIWNGNHDRPQARVAVRPGRTKKHQESFGKSCKSRRG